MVPPGVGRGKDKDPPGSGGGLERPGALSGPLQPSGAEVRADVAQIWYC